MRASHEGAGRFAGTFSLAEGAHEATLNFTVQLDRRGADLRLTMAPTPMADAWCACSATTCPRRRHVQVGGTLAFTANARWPDGTWQAKPLLRDFTVAGLGTERLLDAQLPTACRTSASDSAVLAGWLPRALIAAEDARFLRAPRL